MNPLIQKFQERVQLLDTITPETKRGWGVMSPQNMIEHLGGLIYATAKGKTGMSLAMPPEKAAQMKARFFTSHYPFPRGVSLALQIKHRPPHHSAMDLLKKL